MDKILNPEDRRRKLLRTFGTHRRNNTMSQSIARGVTLLHANQSLEFIQFVAGGCRVFSGGFQGLHFQGHKEMVDISAINILVCGSASDFKPRVARTVSEQNLRH
jgi:hypothetical protein